MLGKDATSQEDFMSIIQTSICDELERYLVDSLLTTITSYLKKDPKGVVRYWIEHWGCYTSLFKVALRIVATITFIVNSEKHFSVVKD